MSVPVPTVYVTCINCKYRYDVEEQFIGNMIECPKCKNAFYAKSESKSLHETIAFASAATTSRILRKTESTRIGVKKRLIARRIKLFVIYPIFVLIGMTALWKGIKFFSRMTDDPDEKTAFIKAIKHIKDENILDLDKMEFDKDFKFSVIDYKERIFRISAKMTPATKKKEKGQSRLFHVDLIYLGHGEWKVTSWGYDK